MKKDIASSVTEFHVNGRRRWRTLGLIDSADPDWHVMLVVLCGLLLVLAGLTGALAYSIAVQ